MYYIHNTLVIVGSTVFIMGVISFALHVMMRDNKKDTQVITTHAPRTGLSHEIGIEGRREWVRKIQRPECGHKACMHNMAGACVTLRCDFRAKGDE